MKKYSFIPLLAATCLSAESAIIVGVTATADSNFDSSRSADRLVDLSGLSTGAGGGQPDMTSTHADHQNGLDQWHTAVGVIADTNVTFALNGIFDLTEVYIWNHNQHSRTDRGVSEFDILVSSDGTNFTEVASNLTLTRSPGGRNSAETLNLIQNGVSHVRFHIDSNHGSAAVVGLSEVMFDGSTSAVPEPTSALLLGLGSCSVLLRRRRK